MSRTNDSRTSNGRTSDRRAQTVAKHEIELREPVDLCLPNGRLNPQAVGWSRSAMVRPNLKGWGRNKRFEYWCIATPTQVFALNISHSDYRSTLAAFSLDLHSLTAVSEVEVRWLPPRKNALPGVTGVIPIEGIGKRLAIRMTPTATGTHLSLVGERLRAELDVVEPRDHEFMGVVVPWDDRRFQYTRKDNCLEVQGVISVDGVEHAIERGEGAYATLDHGRGRWPYSILWNWASGSGTTDGHEIGLQFGAKWTDGTPSTENALRIDGRIEKISADVDWNYDTSNWLAPWTITSDRVDLHFTPVYNRASRYDRLIFLSREDQVFGYFDGTVTSESGRTYRVERVFGWAEEVARRW